MSSQPGLEASDPPPLVRQLCRYLYERSTQATVAVEGRTRVVSYANPAYARLVERDEEGLVGRPFAETVPEGEGNGCMALLDRVFRTGAPENLAEQEHGLTEARTVYWSYALWPIFGPDGRPAGVMIQVTDSTETVAFRRQVVGMNESLLISATRQHELAEAAESLSARLRVSVQAREHFLAVMSHELRNPLAAMGTGLALLRLAANDPVVVGKAAGMIDRQFQQLVHLVDDLLDVSRIATGKVELHRKRVDIAALLRDAVEGSRPQIDRGGHRLTVTLPPGPIPVDADPIRLGQVFLNLLNNAAKYTDPGGHIRLSTRRDAGEVVVSIRDAGIGIAAAHLPHIFDVFVQVDAVWKRSQGGLGIGLSLVKEFVALHGGRVEAFSAGLGKGSEFVVRLPIAAGTDSGASPIETAGEARGPKRRILVVDDNRDAAMSLAMLLEIMGHEVVTAHGGEEGVGAAAAFRPEVILMDLGMPNVDGYEAARRIRAEPWGRDPFLVALTGWGADEDRRRTGDAGFDRHLVKPVDPGALTNLIAEHTAKLFRS